MRNTYDPSLKVRTPAMGGGGMTSRWLGSVGVKVEEACGESGRGWNSAPARGDEMDRRLSEAEDEWADSLQSGWASRYWARGEF